jgi:hypothetical protein
MILVAQEKALQQVTKARLVYQINYPAAIGRGMKDPTHKAKKVSPQAVGK